MDAAQAQAFHDTLAKLKPKGRSGLGSHAAYNSQHQDNGLPKNALYANFVREMGDDFQFNEYGDGRVIKRNFDDCDPELIKAEEDKKRKKSSDRKLTKEERKAVKKAAKMEAKRKAKLEEKREAKRLAKAAKTLEQSSDSKETDVDGDGIKTRKRSLDEGQPIKEECKDKNLGKSKSNKKAKKEKKEPTTVSDTSKNEKKSKKEKKEKKLNKEKKAKQ